MSVEYSLAVIAGFLLEGRCTYLGRLLLGYLGAWWLDPLCIIGSAIGVTTDEGYCSGLSIGTGRDG